MRKLLKYLPLITLLVFYGGSAFSQVDKIKDASDKNQEARDAAGNKDNSGSDYKSGGRSGPGCGGCIADACFSGCINSLGYALTELQSDQLKKKKSIPSVISLEIMPHFAANQNKSWMMMPRVRGNWGIFSSDFRFYALIDPDKVQGADLYLTYDWQVLQINLLILEPLTLRLGTGFMKEDYQGVFFNEHSFGADVRLNDEQHLINTEYRMAFDYITGKIPRTEVNLRYNYSLGEMKNLRIYAMAGGLYQNYFSAVDLWCVQAGLLLSLR